MARQAASGLLGIHINLPATVPPEVDAALASGGPAPGGLSEQERMVFDGLATYRKSGGAAYNTQTGKRDVMVRSGTKLEFKLDQPVVLMVS